MSNSSAVRVCVNLNNATGPLLSWTAGDAEHQGHLPDPGQGSNWKSPLGSTGKSLCLKQICLAGSATPKELCDTTNVRRALVSTNYEAGRSSLPHFYDVLHQVVEFGSILQLSRQIRWH